MLKLKLQYFGHLMQGANSKKKTLMLGKIEGRRKRWHQRMWWLDGIQGTRTWANSWEMVREREAWCAAVHEVSKNWTRLSNWMTTGLLFLLANLQQMFLPSQFLWQYNMLLQLSRFSHVQGKKYENCIPCPILLSRRRLWVLWELTWLCGQLRAPFTSP